MSAPPAPPRTAEVRGATFPRPSEGGTPGRRALAGRTRGPYDALSRLRPTTVPVFRTAPAERS